MSTFDIPGNYDSVPNTYFNDAWNHLSPQIQYTKRSDEIFIYSNYPEYPTSSQLGDSNTPCYINKVNVSGKTKMHIYSTHHLDNLANAPYYLAIRVYNPSSTKTVHFTKVAEGFSNEKSWNNPGYAWEDFLPRSNNLLSLGHGESDWLTTRTLSKAGTNAFLDYFGEFTVDNPFLIAIYICKNKSAIPNNTTEIDWDNNNTYSGYANNYALTGSKPLDMADALVSYEKSFFFGISNPYEYNNNIRLGSTDEMIPFFATQGNHPIQNNIGNYGLQYNLKFTFRNTSNTPVKVKAYIISNGDSHFAGIARMSRVLCKLQNGNII